MNHRLIFFISRIIVEIKKKLAIEQKKNINYSENVKVYQAICNIIFNQNSYSMQNLSMSNYNLF